MFFEPGHHSDVGLSHNPFKALIMPRPIGWISTCDRQGRPNLAPYSFFNAVSDDPPLVMFSASSRETHTRKDTLVNVEATGEFVVNLATHKLARQVKATGAALAPGEDEFAHAGLTQSPSELVAAARVAESPAHLECLLYRTIPMPAGADGRHCTLVIGRVVGLHIDAAMIRDGKVDVAALQPLARLGYSEYASIFEAFEP